MTRPMLTQWLRHVQRHAVNDGMVTTAQVWADYCWNWRSGATPDAERSHGLTAAALARRHHRPVSTKTVERRLIALQSAGLLERIGGHSRHGTGNTFAPSLPQNRTEESGIADQNRTDPSGLEIQNRTIRDPKQDNWRTPTVLSEVQNPPTGGRVGAGARTREDRGEEHQQPHEGHAVLADLLRDMDVRWGEGTASRLSAARRAACVEPLRELRAMGWPSNDLVHRLNAREWASATNIGQTLRRRIADIAEETPPENAAQRKARRVAREDRPPCGHGTPGGCSSCPWCRRGGADEDGVLCDQCCPPPAADDGLYPRGFTPPLTDFLHETNDYEGARS